jgi:putative Holliday junction resolvase
VGLPITLRGEHGEQAAAARAFAEQLERRVTVPVELHDERLTTRLAERTGGAGDEDSRAAAHLLESYLAALAKRPPRPGAQAPPPSAGARE